MDEHAACVVISGGVQQGSICFLSLLCLAQEIREADRSFLQPNEKKF